VGWALLFKVDIVSEYAGVVVLVGREPCLEQEIISARAYQ